VRNNALTNKRRAFKKNKKGGVLKGVFFCKKL